MVVGHPSNLARLGGGGGSPQRAVKGCEEFLSAIGHWPLGFGHCLGLFASNPDQITGGREIHGCPDEGRDRYGRWLRDWKSHDACLSPRGLVRCVGRTSH